MPGVYVVILNYKIWQDTIECLESLLRSHYQQFVVFVIDNHSQNQSLENIKTWCDRSATRPDLEASPGYMHLQARDIASLSGVVTLPKIILIQNESNTGFAAGNNIVLDVLKEKEGFIWLLNPDTVVEQNTLTELVRHYEADKDKLLLGSVNKSYKERDKVLFYGGGRVNFISGTVHVIKSRNKIHKLEYISGGCLFTHAQAYKTVGLLPEDYFLYWEETDWCYQARQKGYKMGVCLEAICYDKISASIGKSYLAEFYYTRNGLIFLSKYRPKNIPFVFILSVVRFAKKVITGRLQNARGIVKGVQAFLKYRKHAG